MTWSIYPSKSDRYKDDLTTALSFLALEIGNGTSRTMSSIPAGMDWPVDRLWVYERKTHDQPKEQQQLRVPWSAGKGAEILDVDTSKNSMAVR